MDLSIANYKKNELKNTLKKNVNDSTDKQT